MPQTIKLNLYWSQNVSYSHIPVNWPLLIYSVTAQTDMLDWEFLVKVSFPTALCRTMWKHSIRTRHFLVQQNDLRNELLKLVLFIFPQSNSLFGGVVLFDRGVWDFVSIFSEIVASPRQKARRKASMINTSKPPCSAESLKKNLFLSLPMFDDCGLFFATVSAP